jgi:hypothetical protein
MPDKSVEQNFKELLEGIGRKLKTQGFTKRGNAYRRVESGNSAIVELQRSQSSTSDTIRFTINVGIVCGRLLDEYQPDVSKSGSMHAHLRTRIGAFLPGPADQWWDLDKTTEPDFLVAELSPLLDVATRFLLDHASDAQLIALWESGQSPGLTDGQRQRVLSELKTA